MHLFIHPRPASYLLICGTSRRRICITNANCWKRNLLLVQISTLGSSNRLSGFRKHFLFFIDVDVPFILRSFQKGTLSRASWCKICLTFVDCWLLVERYKEIALLIQISGSGSSNRLLLGTVPLLFCFHHTKAVYSTFLRSSNPNQLI